MYLGSPAHDFLFAAGFVETDGEGPRKVEGLRRSGKTVEAAQALIQNGKVRILLPLSLCLFFFVLFSILLSEGPISNPPLVLNAQISQAAKTLRDCGMTHEFPRLMEAHRARKGPPGRTETDETDEEERIVRESLGLPARLR
jgi:hypothetical protein